MAKIVSVFEAALTLARDRYGSWGENLVDIPNKIEIAEEVIHIVKYMISDPDFVDLETITSLDYDYDRDLNIYPDNNTHESASVYENSDDDSEGEGNSDTLSQPTSQEEETVIDNVKLTYQEMVNILSFYDKIKKRKLEQTKHRYKKVQHRTTILRIREYVNKKNTVAN